MDENEVFDVGQKAFIERGDKLLVLIDPVHGVDLPGGRIQKGERNLTASMQRELEEEVQLVIQIDRPILTWIWDKKDKNLPSVFLVGYKCNYVSGELKLSSEHSEFFWVDQSDFRSKLDEHWDENNPTCKAIAKYFEIK